MSDNERFWHLKVSRNAGRASSCTGKQNYKSEDTATRIAKELNDSGKMQKELEHYPCYWCQGWHIGGKIERTEMAKK